MAESEGRATVQDFVDQIKGAIVLAIIVWLVSLLAIFWFVLTNEFYWATAALLTHSALMVILFGWTVKTFEFMWSGYNLLAGVWTRSLLMFVVVGFGLVFAAHHFFNGAGPLW